MIITDRMRSDIEALVKRNWSKGRIINQIVLEYHLTPYNQDPHNSIAERKTLTKQIEAMREKQR